MSKSAVRNNVVTPTLAALPALANIVWFENTSSFTAFALITASALALSLRRIAPVVVTLVCGLSLVALYAMGFNGELLVIPTMVALYTLAAEGSRKRTITTVATATLLLSATTGPSGAEPLSISQLLWPTMALLLGDNVRSHRLLVARMAAESAQKNAERERQAQQRLQQERTEIAREVHDVLAHTVTAMNVQCNLAIDAFNERPDIARNALEEVKIAGRHAMAELRIAVSLLRNEAAETDKTPAPVLADLPELVSRLQSEALDIHLQVEPSANEPTRSVQATAYRIVQESLTNVIRHAHARNATVSVYHLDEQLIIEVVDDGIGPDAHRQKAGFGLTGMRERAASVGGTFECGGNESGGFRTRAALPCSK